MTQNHTLEASGEGVGFTPGEWRMAWTFDGGFHIEDAGKNIICRRGPWPHNRVKSEANGRLIAAAPELLEALQETWAVLRAAGLLNLSSGVQLGQTSWYVKICFAETMSEAAVRKALGSDPQPIPIEGGDGSSVARLPARVADATATDTQHYSGKKD